MTQHRSQYLTPKVRLVRDWVQEIVRTVSLGAIVATDPINRATVTIKERTLRCHPWSYFGRAKSPRVRASIGSVAMRGPSKYRRSSNSRPRGNTLSLQERLSLCMALFPPMDGTGSLDHYILRTPQVTGWRTGIKEVQSERLPAIRSTVLFAILFHANINAENRLQIL